MLFIPIMIWTSQANFREAFELEKGLLEHASGKLKIIRAMAQRFAPES